MIHTDAPPHPDSDTIQGAPFAVARVDPGGRLLAWNTAAARIFAVGSDDAVGRPIAEVIAVPGGEVAWQALLAEGAAGRREWATRRVDGQVVHVRWTLRPLAGGGAVCYGETLVEAASAEDQRARSIALRALIDNLDAILWVVDPNGVVTLHEGKGLARLGWKSGHLLGRNLVDLYGPQHTAVLDGMAGKPGHFFMQEGEAHFENWMVPMFGAQGEFSALVGIALDITTAKQREDDLKSQIDVIERQQRAMREMSTPIIEIWDRVLCLPIIGLVDTVRAGDVMDMLLQAVNRTRARYAILDLTGVDVLDTSTASHLLGLTRALSLLGTEGVLTGIQPNIAQTVVALGIDLSGLIVRATLRDALVYVLAALERR
jgi:rsbT co-antagonist protein RsbR